MAPASILALAVSLLLPLSASASSLSSGAIILRAEDVLARPYASLTVSSSIIHARADAANATYGVSATADGSLNITTWNAATDSACAQALSLLSQSTNPSGACVCYNLPSLDVDTGAFEADLRLYKISEPRGTFAGIAPEDVAVALSYNGASVMPVNASKLSGSGMVGSFASIVKRGTPEALQTYLFIGQIDKDRLEKNMSM